MAGWDATKEQLTAHAPVYLRRVPKSGSWRLPDTGNDPGAVEHCTACFKDNQGISVWRIETDADTARVVAGMNDRRDPMHNEQVVLCLTEADLDSAGARIRRSPGLAGCGYAKDRHFDIEYDPERVRALIRVLHAREARTVKLNKNSMKDAISEAAGSGCRVHAEAPSCPCPPAS